MRKFVFYCCTFLLLPSLCAQNLSSQNLELLGRLTYDVFLNDIWGYTADGREYALVGTFEGISIVEVTNPRNPTELHFIPDTLSAWRDLKTYGTFAYVSNETSGGVKIIDLSGLPDKVEEKDIIMEGVTTAHNLYQDEGYLYVVGIDRFQGGMLILDLTEDPWNPKTVGVYNQRYVHDTYVRNGLAYNAEINSGLLTIVDVSNPANPIQLGTHTYTRSLTHNTWLNDAGEVCFTTDERTAAFINAWDVSDPTNVRFLDRIRSSLSNEEAIPHNVHVLDDFLITSYYKDGVHLVDASRPHNLIEVGHYDTSEDSGGGTDGCWGAYPFLPSGIILATDIDNGLFVLQPDYTRGCYLEGTVTDAETGNGVEGVDIRIVETNNPTQSITAGTYALGELMAGTYTVEVSKFGYEPQTFTVALANGELEIRDIALTPSPRTRLVLRIRERGNLAPIADAKVQLVAEGERAFFDYTADMEGEVLENELVIGNYEVLVGKWGFQTQQLSIETAGAENEIEILLPQGYYDDFALDFGWETGGDAADGEWERARPQGTTLVNELLNPAEDSQGDLGEEAFTTGPFGTTFHDEDVDRGRTWLLSPVMDVSQYEDPWLEFEKWYVCIQHNINFIAGNDSLTVELVGETDTVILANYFGPLQNNWERHRFQLSEFWDLQKPVRLRITAADTSPENFVEAGIDQVVVKGGNISTAVNPALTSIFQVGPVPVKEKLTVYFSPADFSFSHAPTLVIYDLTGRKMTTYPLAVGEASTTLPFPFVPGIYVCVLQDGENKLGSVKVVK